MELLIPTGLDLAGWAGVLFATLVLIGLGRLLSAGRAAPEAALVAGWGGAVLALTLWGVMTPASLRLPAIALVAAGVLGHLMPGSRLARVEWRSVGRIAAVALPLLAVMASARVSLPDTFLNLLPNAAYLYDHASFPADLRPPAYSFLPGAPYNLQLAAFIASLVTPGFPTAAMIGLNLVLQIAAGLLLARLVASGDDATRQPPSWGVTALGLLLATAFNPGFVPRYHVSAYSEPSVTVTLAFAGWFAAVALERLAAGRAAGMALWLMGLTLAALVNIKQDSVAIVAGVLLTTAVLALAARPRQALRPLLALGLAAVPAVILYGAWRWYVLTHFAVGELKPLPLAQWQLHVLPVILWHMLETIANKGFFFGVLAATLVVTVLRLRRRGLDLATRAGLLLAGSALVYNAALVLAYVGHFSGESGADAHSYFRYSTHLSLLLMVAIVLLARSAVQERGWSLEGRWRRVVPPVLIAIMLASPLVFLRYLRFDLEVPQSRVWVLEEKAAPLIGAHDRVALLLPGDNGSVAAMLETVLRVAPPRRRDLDIKALDHLAPDTLAALGAAGYRAAILSCSPPGFGLVPAGRAAVLLREGGAWRAAAVWSYPPPPKRARWSQVLTPAALCL